MNDYILINGQQIHMSDLTMSHIAMLYIEEKILSKITQAIYLEKCKIFDRDNAYKPFSSLTFNEVTTWRNNLISRTSPATWNIYRRHLAVLCKWSVLKGYIEHDANHFIHLKNAATHCTRPKTVSIDDLSTLINAFEANQLLEPGWFWVIVIKMLYRTGMRRRQLAELRWSDILWQDNAILLRAESSKTKREWTVPLDNQKELLQALSNLRERIYFKSGKKPDLNSHIFQIQWFNRRYIDVHDQYGLSVQQLSAMFGRVKKKTGIVISSHRLRHTMATEIGSLPEAPLALLKVMLGHTSLQTTMLYISPSLRSLRGIQSMLPII